MATPESSGRGGRGGGRGGPPAVLAPDGKVEAALVNKPLPAKAPSAASEFEKRHQQRFKGVTFDWKDFQRDGAEFPAPDPTAQPAQQIALRPRGEAAAAKVIADLDLRPAGLTWHPDGRRLAFTADPDWRDALKYNSSDLWTVTIDGEVTRLTNDDYVYASPDYSPDGRYLAYERSFGTDMIIRERLNHGGPQDLYVVPLAGGAPINLTASWDLDPGPAQWSPDSRYLYFSAAIGGESHMFRASVPDGKVEQITTGPRRLNGLTYNRSFTKILYTVGVHHAPPDLYVADIDGSNERRLTNVHAILTRDIAFSRAERLRWRSRDGTEIEGWLTPPHGYDASRGPYPMIVKSHGGPHAATGYAFDFKDQYFAARGYFVLDTNFRSSTGYGDAFKWATWGAWGDKDGQDVIAGIDYVLGRYPIDGKRVGHIGHSYGGFMTNWLITQYPDRFAAAVAGAGISNWISDYGTADIYRTKETEFFGTPWEARRPRPDDQAVPDHLRRRSADPDALRPWRGRPARAVRGSRTDVLCAAASGRTGEDDPLRRAVARHRRQLEHRPSDAERARLVRHVSQTCGRENTHDQPGPIATLPSLTGSVTGQALTPQTRTQSHRACAAHTSSPSASP